MLPHFGHMRIWPIADSSRTLSRALQVVHVIEYGFMVDSGDPNLSYSTFFSGADQLTP